MRNVQINPEASNAMNTVFGGFGPETGNGFEWPDQYGHGPGTHEGTYDPQEAAARQAAERMDIGAEGLVQHMDLARTTANGLGFAIAERAQQASGA